MHRRGGFLWVGRQQFRGADVQGHQLINRLRVRLAGVVAHCQHRAGLAWENLAAEADDFHFRVKVADNGNHRLAHGCHINGFGEQRLLGLFNPHRQNLDLVRIELADFLCPIARDRIGHRACGLGGNFHLLAGFLEESRNRRRRRAGFCYEIGKGPAPNQSDFFRRGRRQHRHTNAIGLGDDEGANARIENIELAGRERLDHRRATIEAGDLQIEPRRLRPAFTFHHEQLRDAENGDIADLQLHLGSGRQRGKRKTNRNADEGSAAAKAGNGVLCGEHCGTSVKI